MNYITSTQLRTNTSSFIEALLAGKTIDLIHRSKKLGTLTLEQSSTKTTNHQRLANNIKTLNLPHLSSEQMKKNYHQHMMQKYGQGLS
jgi:hypothetical protein